MKRLESKGIPGLEGYAVLMVMIVTYGQEKTGLPYHTKGPLHTHLAHA